MKTTPNRDLPPLPELFEQLCRAGWGELRPRRLRGCVVVLGKLARELDPVTGNGSVTATELGARASYTERWVRRCLTELEDRHLIRWDRGGIIHGKPTPSRIHVYKSTLLELIRDAEARP